MLSFQIQHLKEDLDLNISADIGSGVTALFGPSGGGKTSLLRSIAGLN
ncbi:MAG TPA: molybdenum ABC transporter ATP-binding protein, partial [Gammaproteobacteria bacterium]|nr:molybdenum ABC transporter ATP-binding protein [Gammaproteobacteria bacterium]